VTSHIQTRAKLKEICLVTAFEDLLDLCTLSDIDKEILRLHYLKEKDFRFIGDELGFSESAIKQRHRKALKKLGNII
jgi:RNA polymerase sigma factor (sigma-70 family)